MVERPLYLRGVTALAHPYRTEESATPSCAPADPAGFTPRIVVGDPIHASANLVMFGDNVAAMQHLLAHEHLEGMADLIYIDMPFCTGRVFEGQEGRTGYSDVFSSDAASDSQRPESNSRLASSPWKTRSRKGGQLAVSSPAQQTSPASPHSHTAVT
jgi:hypothetical protein